ncbi:MAG: dynamin family protein [Clostridiales bacterium]
MNNILCLGDFSSGKSAFLNMLLGVSILPEQLQSTNLPVIKIHAGEAAGIFVLEKGQQYGRFIASFNSIPEDWSSFEYVELTVPNHPLLDKGLVLWDSPGVNSSNEHHGKYLENFLRNNEITFNRILYFIHGNIENFHIEFIKKWPELQRDMVIIVNIKEIREKDECYLIYDKVKNDISDHFPHIPAELLYIGDLYEEFAVESKKKTEAHDYDERECIALWRKIVVDFDELKNKHQSAIIGEDIFEILKDETSSKYKDLKEFERLRQLADEYWQATKYSECFPILLMLAKEDNPDIQYKLGKCHYEGYGTETDYSKAFDWFSLAANKSHEGGQFYSGLCYFYGRGVALDYEKAAEMLLLSARQGNADAQYYIALLYESGNGVEKNYSEAVRWWQSASQMGHSFALYELACCYYEGKGFKKDYKTAVKLFSESDKNGNAYAAFKLGEIYSEGNGVKKDISLAKILFRKAAKNGDDELKKNVSAVLKSIKKKRKDKFIVSGIFAIIAVVVVAAIISSTNQSYTQSAYDSSKYEPSSSSSDTYDSGNKAATYINVTNDYISFPAEGGSKSIYISTNGDNWDVRLETADWIWTSRDGNTLTINCSANTDEERTDYFNIESDGCTHKINISQSADLTRPSASIEKVWVDYDVWDGDRKGLNIHVKFEISNLKNVPCECNAYFSYSGGDKLKDFNDMYHSSDGQVCVSKNFKPTYDASIYEDFQIFMPTSELHMASGVHNLKFEIQIFSEGGTPLADSEDQFFTLTKSM